MTAYDATLLPPADESERCAAHAERIDLDPGGSALWVDELIVVDMPLPWPKPVWAKEGYTAVPELVMDAEAAGRRIRVLAAVPLDDGIGRVVTHRLAADGSFARTEHHLRPVGVDPGDVIDLLTVLIAESLDCSPTTVVDSARRRELLLCTQGSHDVCCGTRGMALESELRDAGSIVPIRRVSHTGGHRLAPTGVTLPDGRMWGMVTTAEMVGILNGALSPGAVARRCRGWIGAEPGPAQVAERAVMAEIDDWSFDHTARTVVVDGEAATITTDVGTWQVDVVDGRAVPTIACGEPGGLPAKPGAEWQVRSISRVAD